MEDKSGGHEVYYAPQNPPPYSSGPPPQGPMTSVTVVQQPMGGTTVVPALLIGPNMGPKPQSVNCSHCTNSVVTRITFKPSMRTHLCAALLFLFACWPCMCIPYCVGSCNNIDHYCPNCGAYIGTYRHN